MSESQDIRVWARDHGYTVSDRGRLPGEVVEAYGARDDDEDEAPELMVAAPEAEARDIPQPPEPPAERPPVQPPQARSGRLFQRKPSPPAKKGQKRPAHPRVSTETLLSSLYGIAAMGLARWGQQGQGLPVARMMDMQAPVFGLVADDLIRGTLADKFLQPLARAGQKGEIAVGLAGPPLLVGLMTARPALFPVLRPMLKMSMMTWMEIAEPKMRQVQKRAETWSEKFGDVDLDAMIDALWAGLPEAGPESPQEEEHVRRARGDDAT